MDAHPPVCVLTIHADHRPVLRELRAAGIERAVVFQYARTLNGHNGIAASAPRGKYAELLHTLFARNSAHRQAVGAQLAANHLGIYGAVFGGADPPGARLVAYGAPLGAHRASWAACGSVLLFEDDAVATPGCRERLQRALRWWRAHPSAQVLNLGWINWPLLPVLPVGSGVVRALGYNLAHATLLRRSAWERRLRGYDPTTPGANPQWDDILRRRCTRKYAIAWPLFVQRTPPAAFRDVRACQWIDFDRLTVCLNYTGLAMVPALVVLFLLMFAFRAR